MKTVLFAWEHGGGFGHIANLGRFAALLKRPDVRVVFALKNPEAAYLLDANAEVLQAPPWPTAQSFRSTATMHDQLASAGLSDEHGLRSLLQSWDNILKAASPDLVVADYAPAVSLMARGRIPLIVVGNGYTAPPGAMTRFPPLHRVHPPRWREEETLETVNRVLQSLARPPLERLPQMFSGNAQIVLTFPVLDPYDLQRSEALAGPIIDSPPLEPRKNADDIFVYLSRAVLSALPLRSCFGIAPRCRTSCHFRSRPRERALRKSVASRSAYLLAAFAFERDTGIGTARNSLRWRRTRGTCHRRRRSSVGRRDPYRTASERTSAREGRPRKSHRQFRAAGRHLEAAGSDPY